ncbi:unnamed protein product [Prorocentrum cordatum]|uniref:Uncharacterized protein n=1 Tax=Prorocentrum cordatum TaxID=2364126 RepID=A0ABN9SY29_9DINO|nr:unnamed protein product [Polarella glacialis]
MAFQAQWVRVREVGIRQCLAEFLAEVDCRRGTGWPDFGRPRSCLLRLRVIIRRLCAAAAVYGGGVPDHLSDVVFDDSRSGELVDLGRGSCGIVEVEVDAEGGLRQDRMLQLLGPLLWPRRRVGAGLRSIFNFYAGTWVLGRQMVNALDTVQLRHVAAISKTSPAGPSSSTSHRQTVGTRPPGDGLGTRPPGAAPAAAARAPQVVRPRERSAASGPAMLPPDKVAAFAAFAAAIQPAVVAPPMRAQPAVVAPRERPATAALTEVGVAECSLGHPMVHAARPGGMCDLCGAMGAPPPRRERGGQRARPSGGEEGPGLPAR